MRITRKRAKQSMESDSALDSGSVGLLEPSTGKGFSPDKQKKDASNAYVQPECCQSNIDNEGPCKCLFQNLVECLTGMKVSVANHPEGRCIHAVHQSSGYSFNLTWLNKASPGSELLYHVSSLGTFANVAPEWMRDVIIFSVSMCPIFFERVSRIIKHH
ncbi:CCR4-NOT transcription complex subunit 6-like-B [Bienertia sinuspersici]